MKRFSVSTLLAVLMASFVIMPVRAHAGTSYIYMQAGQAELGSATPCSPATAVAYNGQPYTVQECTMTSADTMYFHFTVPADFNATNSSSHVHVLVDYMPKTDATASRRAYFQASITVFPISGGADYTVASLATVAAPSYQTALTTGALNIVYTKILNLSMKNAAAAGATCTSDCVNGQAVLKLQRTTAGGSEVDGVVQVVAVTVFYDN